MPHFVLTHLLRKAWRQSLQKQDGSGGKFMESRRKFVRDIGLVAGGTCLVPSFAKAITGETQPVISVVGAGMAGLNTTYQLQKLGLEANLYEASARAGGRMYTLTGKFGNNITTDLGGEYVDATHSDIINLARELGVHFYDLRQDELLPHTFYFRGTRYSNEDLLEAIMPFASKIETDVLSLPSELNYKTAPAFKRLDEMSIMDYTRDIGITGWLSDFLNVILTREYGMEASEQSAINLLIMFADPMGANQGYELFGQDHEVLKITGGSQHLTDRLSQSLNNKVIFNHRLQSVKPSGTGYTINFLVQGKTKNIYTDYLVLAMPFSILKDIPIAVKMPPGKIRCINEMGYGNSGKFIMGTSTKPWRDAGQRGYTFTDLEFGCGWDSSLMQSESEGCFTIFGGGKFMDETCRLTDEGILKNLLPQLNKIYPGFSKAFNTKTMKYCWSKNPFTKAGYSSYKKGQWSTLAGWEQTPVGNMFFAGEHVCNDFQGYMNGAAKTGREAAEMIYEKVMTKKDNEMEA